MTPFTMPLDRLGAFLDQLLVGPGSLFLRSGRNVFVAIALILVVWTGIETALDGVDRRKLMRLLAAIAFGLTMIYYYTRPIPGIGYSFTDMFRAQTLAMSQTLSAGSANALQAHSQQLMLGVPVPAFTSIHLAFVYLSLAGLAMMLTIAVFCVVAYGAIGQAACFIVGPLFIPWFLVPKLDFLFWSWLKATLQFSFYKVVATIVISITAQIQISVLGSSATSVSNLLLEWPIRAAACLISCLLIFHIPTITNSLFTGSAGSSGGALTTVVAAAVVLRNVAVRVGHAVAGAASGGATTAATAITTVAVKAAETAAQAGRGPASSPPAPPDKGGQP